MDEFVACFQHEIQFSDHFFLHSQFQFRNSVAPTAVDSTVTEHRHVDRMIMCASVT